VIETQSHFDLALAYPQWQGSGRPENLPRGALAAAAVCSQFAPLETVPLDVDESDAHGVRRWNAIFSQFRAAQKILARRQPERVLVAGGDCAVDIAVIDYLIGRYPDLNVLWVDAHLDANTAQSSSSGNLHGMPVAAIMGHAPAPMKELLGAPLNTARFQYFGVQVGDEGDREFERTYRLRTLSPDDAPSGPLHIHFDLDVLDPAEFPHLAYTEGKLAIDDAVELVRRLAREANIVGFTVTEFAPTDDGAARDGSEVIALLCEAATGRGGS